MSKDINVDDILACPFCGSRSLSLQMNRTGTEAIASLACKECFCKGPQVLLQAELIDEALGKDKIPDKLIELWNERK